MGRAFRDDGCWGGEESCSWSMGPQGTAVHLNPVGVGVTQNKIQSWREARRVGQGHRSKHNRELLQEDRGGPNAPTRPATTPIPHPSHAMQCDNGGRGGSSSGITPALEVTMSREKGSLSLTLSSRLGIWSLRAGPSPAQRRILSLHSQ